MKFRYSGANALPQMFGMDWLPGDEKDVSDAHAIRKLGNNPMFAAVEGAAAFAETKTAIEEGDPVPVKKPRKAKAKA